MTAVSLSPCDRDKHGNPIETGIPFYLPKPLLIVSKNFRNIEEAKTGLTGSAPIPTGFDDQSKYADLNARTNFAGLNGAAAADDTKQSANPNAGAGTAEKSDPTLFSATGAPISPRDVPGDGLAPNTFYTYQIVFVPDLTQKYGLKIRGGPGEMRAAMNLVNGWQFTGIGPFYLKDSATAQNILAQGISTRLGGQAAADVLNAAADLAKVAGGLQSSPVSMDDPSVQKMSRAMGALPAGCTPMSIPNFAEIHVYDASLSPDGRMEWHEISHLSFNREYMGTDQVLVEKAPAKAATDPKRSAGAPSPAGLQSAGVDPSVARTAVAAVFGLQPAGVGGTLQSGGGTPTGVPAGGVSQIQVDCDGSGGGPRREFSLFKFGGCKPAPAKARIESRVLTGAGFTTQTAAPDTSVRPSDPTAGGGVTFGGSTTQATGVPTTTPGLTQTFNQTLACPPAVVPPVPPPPPPGGGGVRPPG